MAVGGGQIAAQLAQRAQALRQVLCIARDSGRVLVWRQPVHARASRGDEPDHLGGRGAHQQSVGHRRAEVDEALHGVKYFRIFR